MTSEVSGDAAVGGFGEGHLPHRRRQRYKPEDEERGERMKEYPGMLHNLELLPYRQVCCDVVYVGLVYNM